MCRKILFCLYCNLLLNDMIVIGLDSAEYVFIAHYGVN